jgi:glycosyltransferase involved in cell wall biosynthesis
MNEAAARVSARRASIVIPANNEERVIARLLNGLLREATPGEFEIVVVCNGCTDSTGDVARSVSPEIQVIATPVPSKAGALRLGDAACTTFPRLYVDADVELGASDVRALAYALRDTGYLAVSAERVIPMEHVSRAVRSYYRVWNALPHVAQGLFGRGVVAIGEGGYSRIAALPELMSDDFAMSQAFAPHERFVVRDARVVIYPPRTLRSLFKRRTRSVTGNVQATQAGISRDDARTSVADLLQIGLRSPRLIPGILLFLGMAATARLVSRRDVRKAEFTAWLRDESSR